MIEIYDTLTREKRMLVPRLPGRVSIYTCGVTPYADAHLGHARPAVAWDAIRRHLRRRGYLVTFVQNFTDIDDKLIGRASELNIDVTALADQYIAPYERFMEALRVEPPDVEPRVTQHVTEIVAYIQALMGHGHAYQARGDVYFDVRKDPEYGRLSGRQIEDMQSSGRVVVKEHKRYPEDFALWKESAPGEPGFDSPWGRGRPGWHIECSAMSGRYLGSEFDLHGGGMDLTFPHHENERAQSRAYHQVEPVSFWVHSGLITEDGVKMSKSLQHGTLLKELLDRVDPVVVRTYLLSVHYRSPLDFRMESLLEWETGMRRLWRLWERVRTAPPPSRIPDASWAKRLLSFEERLLEIMDDDFNTARALASVFEMVRDVNLGEAAGEALVALGLARHNLTVADAVLALLPIEGNAREAPEGGSDARVLSALVEAREDARREKNYALSDALRRVLATAGYQIEDTAQGGRVIPREGEK